MAKTPRATTAQTPIPIILFLESLKPSFFCLIGVIGVIDSCFTPQFYKIKHYPLVQYHSYDKTYLIPLYHITVIILSHKISNSFLSWLHHKAQPPRFLYILNHSISFNL